jgi:hypothetical protein
VVAILCCALMTAASASASTASAGGATTGAAAQVRDVYRAVLLAEYFGPANGVCSRLTAGGVKAFTALAGGTSCSAAFARVQHGLRHKIPDDDDSGYTARGWRQDVNFVMAGLKLSTRGDRASAIGPSGIPGKTELVKVGGRWLFSSDPPSVQS